MLKGTMFLNLQIQTTLDEIVRSLLSSSGERSSAVQYCLALNVSYISAGIKMLESESRRSHINMGLAYLGCQLFFSTKDKRK